MHRCAAFKKISHVIFDLDGVILDTEGKYSLGVQNVVSKFGKVYDWSIKLQVMGIPGAEAAKKIVELLELPLSPEEFHKLVRIEYAIVMKDIQLFPDTEIVYQSVIAGIAKRFGKIYTPEIQGKVIGTVERESCRIAVTEMQLPISIDDFQNEFRTNSDAQFHNVPLFSGAVTMIKHFHKNNIPLAVATSSSQESFELKAKNHKEFFSVFRHVVCGGSDPEVKHGKPSPDIFLVCASRFVEKPAPQKCLVFEDAPNGVKAAVAAGMSVVMIPDKNVPDELRKDTPFVLNDILETPLEQFSLPPLKT